MGQRHKVVIPAKSRPGARRPPNFAITIHGPPALPLEYPLPNWHDLLEMFRLSEQLTTGDLSHAKSGALATHGTLIAFSAERREQVREAKSQSLPDIPRVLSRSNARRNFGCCLYHLYCVCSV
jgi:hypothetical protein